jgi:hypothetical protein
MNEKGGGLTKLKEKIFQIYVVRMRKSKIVKVLEHFCFLLKLLVKIHTKKIKEANPLAYSFRMAGNDPTVSF